VWCVHNDSRNYWHDNAQKFDFLVFCCYLVASISMHFKSSEPNSKTLFFGQIKIQKNLSRGPNIKTKLHFDKNSHQKNIHHHLNNIMKLEKKKHKNNNINNIWYISYKMDDVQWWIVWWRWAIRIVVWKKTTLHIAKGNKSRVIASHILPLATHLDELDENYLDHENYIW